VLVRPSLIIMGSHSVIPATRQGWFSRLYLQRITHIVDRVWLDLAKWTQLWCRAHACWRVCINNNNIDEYDDRERERESECERDLLTGDKTILVLISTERIVIWTVANRRTNTNILPRLQSSPAMKTRQNMILKYFDQKKYTYTVNYSGIK